MRISLILNPTFSVPAYHRQLFLSILLLMAAPLACVADGDPASAVKSVSKASHEFRFSSKVDSRGFIDIWQLKRDVAEVEALEVSDETDVCHLRDDIENDDAQSARPDPESIEKEKLNCISRIKEAHKAYMAVREVFNQAWLPALINAMNKADPVAEVILRQCSTTRVINRIGIESTCDRLTPRREMALARLRQIGFMPAIPVTPVPRDARPVHERLALQKVVLNAIVYGNFNEIPYEATAYWSESNPGLNYKLVYNALLIEGFRKNIQQAFSFDSNFYGSDVLVLNKKSFRSNVLSWGNGTIDTITKDWRWTSILKDAESECQRTNSRDCKDAEGQKLWISGDIQSLLETTNNNIAKYMEQDPRWKAFLMKRVSHHEWVPYEEQRVPTKLDNLWLGRWYLDKHYVGLDSEPVQPKGSADISFEGGQASITIQAELNPNQTDQYVGLKNVSGCILHDGGGLTPPSKNQSKNDTTLGNLEALDEFGAYFFKYAKNRWKNKDGRINGFDPFQSDQQYRQILMQCDEGENYNGKGAGRVRFLLLAGDTLVEIAVNAWWDGTPLHIRHFKRVAPVVIPYKEVISTLQNEQSALDEQREQDKFYISGWLIISILVGFIVGISLLAFGVIFAWRKLTS